MHVIYKRISNYLTMITNLSNWLSGIQLASSFTMLLLLSTIVMQSEPSLSMKLFQVNPLRKLKNGSLNLETMLTIKTS